MLATHLFVFIMGFLFNKKYFHGMDTDKCARYLQRQGYTVHLRTKYKF